ncbi:hypothetical protein SLEP1_g169 [Rubroshorea leprosula]|uniref:Disease resistance N-terminal domain-containing protein n=1 Tax=Rubroshorea leprosula TaxID=152421 RepID=A0AAV5HF96_9ROSI|nr:hypothetical protein SLEP1_g169 [Rubroshorea leprosula]
MGDLILGPVIEVTISKLISAAAEQINLAVSWKQELIILQNKLVLIQAVLQDAGQRQVTDMAVKHWLLRLRQVADDADYNKDFKVKLELISLGQRFYSQANLIES